MFVRFDSVGSLNFDLHIVAYDTAQYSVSRLHNGLFANMPGEFKMFRCSISIAMSCKAYCQ